MVPQPERQNRCKSCFWPCLVRPNCSFPHCRRSPPSKAKSTALVLALLTVYRNFRGLTSVFLDRCFVSMHCSHALVHCDTAKVVAQYIRPMSGHGREMRTEVHEPRSAYSTWLRVPCTAREYCDGPLSYTLGGRALRWWSGSPMPHQEPYRKNLASKCHAGNSTPDRSLLRFLRLGHQCRPANIVSRTEFSGFGLSDVSSSIRPAVWRLRSLHCPYVHLAASCHGSTPPFPPTTPVFRVKSVHWDGR